MSLLTDTAMGGDGMHVHVDLGDVDDLFGDGGPLGLETRLPGKRLQLRLDELRRRGCCQGLVWAKNGTIASISADGQSLELRYLRADAQSGSWGLSEGHAWAVPGLLPDVPVVHLSWGPMVFSELVMVDAVGRIMMFSFSSHLNRPGITVRRWDSDLTDDLHVVVGTYWLQSMPPSMSTQAKGCHTLYGPAIRQENTYTHQTAPLPGTPPYHPNPNRSAFFCVTANATLKMFWSLAGNRVQETSVELESVSTSSSGELVTHAAICSEPRAKTLIVALATRKQLQVFQVYLPWGPGPGPGPDNSRQVPGAHLPVNRSLVGKHVAVTSWLPTGTNVDSSSPLDPLMNQISHMVMLPYTISTKAKTTVAPAVLTVRSFVPTADSSSYGQEVQSIIDRYEIVTEQPQHLHPAFVQLASRKHNVGTPAAPGVTRLKKLDALIVDKVVTGIELVMLGQVICFSYSDGSVEYRDRGTLDLVWGLVNLDRFHSIHEIGFSHRAAQPALQTVPSPNNLSLVHMGEDGKIRWQPLECTLEHADAPSDDQHATLVAGLTLASTQAIGSLHNIDDILAVARSVPHSDRLTVDWVSGILRTMMVMVDYAEDAHPDSPIRNMHLQTCLSIVNHMGWAGEYKPRSFGSKLAMLALNLRNMIVVVTVASTIKDRVNPMDDPDVVEALAGCCKWCLDLFCWLADRLFRLLDDTKFMGLLHQQHFPELTPYLVSRNEVALHLMLSSATRGLLSGACRRLVQLSDMSERTIRYHRSLGANNDPGQGPSLALRAAYQKITRYTNSSLISIHDFHSLLDKLADNIRSSNKESMAELARHVASAQGAKQQQQQQQQQPPQQPQQQQQPQQPHNPPRLSAGEEAAKRARSHFELNLLLGGAPPSTFCDVVHRFFDRHVRALKTRTDPAELFFANYSLLEVDDAPGPLHRRKARGLKVDLFKRLEFSPPPPPPPPRKSPPSGGLDGRVVAAADPVGGGHDHDHLHPYHDHLHHHDHHHHRQNVPPPPQWRRCVRCASVMLDRPGAQNSLGANFVIGTQKSCSCGGRLAILDIY